MKAFELGESDSFGRGGLHGSEQHFLAAAFVSASITGGGGGIIKATRSNPIP